MLGPVHGLRLSRIAGTCPRGASQVAGLYRDPQATADAGGLEEAVAEGDFEPAYGASVRLKLTLGGVPRTMLRVLDPGTGYGRTHEPIAHFGLGRGATLGGLTVQWPDGARRALTGLAPDTVVVVPYPAG